MSSWICDGVPKDGKDYPGLGGAHEPKVLSTTQRRGKILNPFCWFEGKIVSRIHR